MTQSTHSSICLRAILTIFLGLSLGSLFASSASQNGKMTEKAQASAESMDVAPNSGNSTDAPDQQAQLRQLEANILLRLHIDNRRKIELAELAKKMGTTRKVRALGNRILRDRGFIDRRVIQLTLARASLPERYSPESVPVLDPGESSLSDLPEEPFSLSNLRGEEFDRKILRVIENDHQRTLEWLGPIASGLPADSEVRELTIGLFPILVQHRDLSVGLEIAEK